MRENVYEDLFFSSCKRLMFMFRSLSCKLYIVVIVTVYFFYLFIFVLVSNGELYNIFPAFIRSVPFEEIVTRFMFRSDSYM